MLYYSCKQLIKHGWEIVMSCVSFNTLSIAYTGVDVKLRGNFYRNIYRVSNKPNRKGAVISSRYKRDRLRLRSRRVANGYLFNNPSLIEAPHYTKSMCKVGLKYRGAERMFMVPITWAKDARGNYRRYITAYDFHRLPQVLRDVAIANGVNTTGDVIFSRCIVAWAGHNVKGMHVHHVNMDTTDDRLGNLWVLTVGEHASVHADKNSLFWDEDWYEYTSTDIVTLRFISIKPEDYAGPTPTTSKVFDGPDPFTLEMVLTDGVVDITQYLIGFDDIDDWAMCGGLPIT